jgi:hypothetical protein
MCRHWLQLLLYLCIQGVCLPTVVAMLFVSLIMHHTIIECMHRQLVLEDSFDWSSSVKSTNAAFLCNRLAVPYRRSFPCSYSSCSTLPHPYGPQRITCASITPSARLAALQPSSRSTQGPSIALPDTAERPHPSGPRNGRQLPAGTTLQAAAAAAAIGGFGKPCNL